MSEIVAEGIIQASALRDYAETFTTIVDEGKIHFNDDGLTTRVVDPAGVCMINPGKLSTEAFEHYDSPGTVTIGVNLNSLTNRLKPASGDDLVNLAVDMETRNLEMEYGRAAHTMALIDVDSIRKEPDVKELDWPNYVTIEGAAIDEMTTHADMVSDHIAISVDPDERELVADAEGDIDDATLTFGDEDLIEANVTEAAKSLFSLDYLKDLNKAIPTDAEVTLHIGEEWPMAINWSVDGLSIEAMLAPRIQTD